MLEGTSDSEGHVALDAGQEALLGQVWKRHPDRLWVLFEGQVKRVDVTRERADWNDLQKLDYALDAMGYADSFGATGSGDPTDFRAPLARQELHTNAAQAIYERFKKGTS